MIKRNCLLLFLKPVSHSPDVFNVPGMGRIRFYLFSKMADVSHDIILFISVWLIPHSFIDLLIGKNSSRLDGEVKEQIELQICQNNLFTLYFNFVTKQINLKFIKLNLCIKNVLFLLFLLRIFTYPSLLLLPER